jgi:hypothetical protein
VVSRHQCGHACGLTGAMAAVHLTQAPARQETTMTDTTTTTTTAPAFAERREQTLQHLRSAIPADALRAAEAIAAAVPRLGTVELLRAGAAIATLADLADGDDAGGSETT